MKKEITVTIKLFSDLAGELSLRDYDAGKGLKLKCREGARVRTLLKKLGLKKPSSLVYFAKGERIGLWTTLNDGDEISCLRPSAGG